MTHDLSRRHLEPEILDGLDPHDPRARASRRDLHRINTLMFQPAIMAALLRRHAKAPPRRVLEIGCGDGRFMLSVARRLAGAWSGVELLMLDRVALVTPATIEAFAALGWRATPLNADIFEWSAGSSERFDIVTTNLFLHHFTDDQLTALVPEVMRTAPLFVATEPLRGRFALIASKLVALIGANDVTRNDAYQSVRAGFIAAEASSIWRKAGGQPLEDRRRGLFTLAFAGRAP